MTWPKLILASVFLFLLTIPMATCFAQALKGSRAPAVTGTGGTSSINWGDKQLAGQLARNVVAGPKITLQHSAQGQSAVMMAALQRKKASGQFGGNLLPGDSGSNQSGMLTGQRTLLASTASTLPAVQNSPLQGEQTQSATGTGNLGSSSGPIADNGTQTPSKHWPPSRPAPVTGPAYASPASLVCKAVISTVDSAKSGAVFSPGYSYAIKGCGFGTTPGQIYLTGIQYQNNPNGRARAPIRLHSDWVRLTVASGRWSDTSIQAVVDPTTSGFYDSGNATLQIITSNHRTLTSPGFLFLATRATQTLTSLPTALYGASSPTQLTILRSGTSFTPARVNDTAGHPVQANLVSPSVNSIVLPGHTFAVVREDNSAGFPAGTDSINLAYGLQPDFQVQSIQPFYAPLPRSACPSTFANSGNWNATQMGSADNISVSWQEQGCGNNGASVYAIDVTVVGPKGVSPF